MVAINWNPTKPFISRAKRIWKAHKKHVYQVDIAKKLDLHPNYVCAIIRWCEKNTHLVEEQ